MPKKNLPPELADLLNEKRHARLSPQEGLDLFKAFTQIDDQPVRQSIVEMVERIADAMSRRDTR